MDNQVETNDLLKEFHDSNTFQDATTGQRFANFLIDYIAFLAVAFAISTVVYWIAVSNNIYLRYFEDDTNPLMDRLYGMIFYAIFYSLTEGLGKGRTLGKLITKTKVVHRDGNQLVFKDYLIRSLSRIVPFEPFSALSGFPWHDKWTNTRVVQIR